MLATVKASFCPSGDRGLLGACWVVGVIVWILSCKPKGLRRHSAYRTQASKGRWMIDRECIGGSRNGVACVSWILGVIHRRVIARSSSVLSQRRIAPTNKLRIKEFTPSAYGVLTVLPVLKLILALVRLKLFLGLKFGSLGVFRRSFSALCARVGGHATDHCYAYSHPRHCKSLILLIFIE